MWKYYNRIIHDVWCMRWCRHLVWIIYNPTELFSIRNPIPFLHPYLLWWSNGSGLEFLINNWVNKNCKHFVKCWNSIFFLYVFYCSHFYYHSNIPFLFIICGASERLHGIEMDGWISCCESDMFLSSSPGKSLIAKQFFKASFDDSKSAYAYCKVMLSKALKFCLRHLY